MIVYQLSLGLRTCGVFTYKSRQCLALQVNKLRFIPHPSVANTYNFAHHSFGLPDGQNALAVR